MNNNPVFHCYGHRALHILYALVQYGFQKQAKRAPWLVKRSLLSAARVTRVRIYVCKLLKQKVLVCSWPSVSTNVKPQSQTQSPWGLCNLLVWKVMKSADIEQQSNKKVIIYSDTNRITCIYFAEFITLFITSSYYFLKASFILQR